MTKNTSFLMPKVTGIELESLKNNRTGMLKKLGYDHSLNETKNQISTIKYSKWTSNRKLTNDYDFPYDHTKIKRPISRAFFKLMEMVVDHNINLDCDSLHLAEAPGGFIESTIYFQNKYKILKKHYTFSIITKSNITPTYHKKIINNNTVAILSNETNKGDLYNISNMKYLISVLADKKIKFITCDGGFTENCDFAAKEELHHKLIFHEIVSSLFILHDGGSMVIKIFDIFTELTFDFVYLLSYLFGKTYICKPDTSRPTNSEKYIICKNYDKSKFNDKIQNFIKNLCSSGVDNYSSFIRKSYINQEFINSIKNVNKLLMVRQISTIKYVLDVIASGEKPIRNNEATIKWIAKYY